MIKTYFMSTYVGFCSMLVVEKALEAMIKLSPPMPADRSFARQHGLHIGLAILALTSIFAGERYMRYSLTE